jgi:hypothetical protein
LPAEPLKVDDGILVLGNAPGLGIELNLENLDRFRLPDPFNIPDGAYSDVVCGREFDLSVESYHQ